MLTEDEWGGVVAEPFIQTNQIANGRDTSGVLCPDIAGFTQITAHGNAMWVTFIAHPCATRQSEPGEVAFWRQVHVSTTDQHVANLRKTWSHVRCMCSGSVIVRSRKVKASPWSCASKSSGEEHLALTI